MSHVKQIEVIKQEIKLFNKKLKEIARQPEGSGDYMETEDSNSEMTEVAPAEMVLSSFQNSLQSSICQKCLPYLYRAREPVANYQAKRGISINEFYTFYALMTIVGQNMYNSVSAMAKMVTNLLPIFDACLLIARFILDKLIDIMESDDDNRLKKAVVFVVEFIPLFFVVGFIHGFIFLPLYALFIAVIAKLWEFIV